MKLFDIMKMLSLIFIFGSVRMSIILCKLIDEFSKFNTLLFCLHKNFYIFESGRNFIGIESRKYFLGIQER